MRLIICDRCKKKLVNPKKIGYVALNWRDPKTDEFAGRPMTEDMDFCDECMDKIANFIQSGDLVPSEQEEEEVIPADEVVPDEDPDPAISEPEPKLKQEPESAAVPAKPKTTVNIGQIRRLAEEGKSITRIAEITGYSYPTVKKYLGRQ